MLSTAITCFEAFCRIVALTLAVIASLFVLVVAVDVSLWIKNPSPDGDTHGGKLRGLFRSRYFWMVFCFAILITICLNVIPFYLSRGSYTTDGCEVTGWPLTFFSRGGFVYVERFDALALVADLLVMIVFAAGTGIGFRNGAGHFLERARMVFRRMRTWPRDDGD